ncbi:MAG: RNA methyltransferase [Candidatus Zixiibacteriota bacterium]
MPLSRSETKNLRALQTRKGRRTSRRFLAEGVRLMEETLRFKRYPARLYFAPSVLSSRGGQVVERFRKAGVATQQVSAGELTRIADTETSQGILAVFELPNQRLGELILPTMRNVLLCENISDPGNVGTLIRTALAFDFDLVVLVGRCAEAFSPKVVRASVGAVFGMPVASADMAETLAAAGRERFHIIAAALQGSDKMDAVLASMKNNRIMLAIGSEADGLSPEMIQAADRLVRIEHSAQVESLNSAIAGAILMKECYDIRSRRK